MSDGIDEIKNSLTELEKLLGEAQKKLDTMEADYKEKLADREEKVYDLEGLLKLRTWQISETRRENELYDGKVGKLETIEAEVEKMDEMPKKDWVRIKELMDQLDDVVDRVKPVKARLKQMHVDLQNAPKGGSA